MAVVYFSCVPVSTAATVALAMTAPVGSRTIPPISPVFICPNAGGPVNAKIPANRIAVAKLFLNRFSTHIFLRLQVRFASVVSVNRNRSDSRDQSDTRKATSGSHPGKHRSPATL